MDKEEALSRISFGERVAEEEVDALASYFVETEQWRRIWNGAADIVYGPKGSGKSAIYFLLSSRIEDLRSRGIALTPAENPRGALAFADLVDDPPTSETEFRSLWKLYFLTLIGEHMRDSAFSDQEAKEVTSALEEAGLLPPGSTLRQKIRSALDYVRALLQIESVEGGVAIDPATGMPAGVTGRISLREPNYDQLQHGVVSLDQLFRTADAALGRAGLTVWIVLDRLDVAFAERRELEENALRALFRVYVDVRGLQRIHFKIFLRDDIWRRITAGGGFREASHITRTETITWDEQSLMNLIVRRAVKNDAIWDQYDVDEETVLGSIANQRALFFRIFPEQVDPGSRRPDTFKWILSRTRDGTGETTPRELIHLLRSLTCPTATEPGARRGRTCWRNPDRIGRA